MNIRVVYVGDGEYTMVATKVNRNQATRMLMGAGVSNAFDVLDDACELFCEQQAEQSFWLDKSDEVLLDFPEEIN